MVGSRVCPPPKACAPSADIAFAASSIVVGLVNSKLYICFSSLVGGTGVLPHLDPDHAFIAAQTRAGDTGMSMCSTS